MYLPRICYISLIILTLVFESLVPDELIQIQKRVKSLACKLLPKPLSKHYLSTISAQRDKHHLLFNSLECIPTVLWFHVGIAKYNHIKKHCDILHAKDTHSGVNFFIKLYYVMQDSHVCWISCFPWLLIINRLISVLTRTKPPMEI